MQKLIMSCSALALSSVAAFAGGIDRSGQPIGTLFEEGNYFELGYGQIRPSVKGTYVPAAGGFATGEVLNNYDLPSITLRYQIGRAHV